MEPCPLSKIIQPSLKDHLKHLTQAKDRQTFIDAIQLISQLHLQSDMDCKAILLRSIKSNTIREAKKLVKGNFELTSLFIDLLTSNKHAKQAAEIITEFKLNPAHFPRVVERVQKSCMRHYFSKFLKEPEDPDSISMGRIEQLFLGCPSMLAYTAQDLVGHNFFKEAAYLITKNKLVSIIRKDVISNLLEALKYEKGAKEDNKQDEKAAEEWIAKAAEGVDLTEQLSNTFGPVEPEHPDKLPLLKLDVPVSFVTNKEELAEMREKLITADVIGMDMEWKPVFTKFDKQRAALLQVGVADKAFIIDLIALHAQKELNEILTEVFTAKNITKVGFSFSSDLAMVLKSYSELDAFRLITPFVDLQRLYKEVMGATSVSLAKATESLLHKRLCKRETSSNWELRPLRKSQIHYAALDAVVLIDLHKLLNEKAEMPALETLSLCKQDSEQSEELKEMPPVAEQQGATANLYELKTSEFKKVAKDLQVKNTPASQAELLKMKFVLDPSVSGLYKYFIEMKLDVEVRKGKWKEISKSLKNENEVFVTTSQRHFEAVTGASILFKEKNAFNQLKQFTAFMKLDMPKHEAEVDPGVIWS